MHQKYRIPVMIIAAAFAVAGTLGVFLSRRDNAEKPANEAKSVLGDSADLSAIVGIAGVDDTAAGSIELNNSWPGEIISSETAHIQPQREGVITSWRVRIGQSVGAGEVLGTISAPPATPELIAMLAERSEAVARARAQATVEDEFAAKEQIRFNALRDSINSNSSGDGLIFASLDGMRKKVEVKKTAVRSFVENAFSEHVLMLTNASDWRFYRYGSFNKSYGFLNPEVQSAYEMALLKLAEALKSSARLPEAEAQNYFALALRLANSSGDGMEAMTFRTMASKDQNMFLEFLAEFREAEAELAGMETEYKIMLSENSAMVEKERSMAHAEVLAMEATYKTVANEIKGGLSIIAPRSGVVSAIYKKTGEIVDPAMPIAVITGYGSGELMVRMRIPNNIRRPKVGEILSVVRPGFPMDVRKVKMTGIGASLDETGSFMADAVILERVDWPVSASVRVIAPQTSNAPVIRLSAVMWNEDSKPYVWSVSEAGRIFSKKISMGRSFGNFIEIYEGLENGERYILSPLPDMKEDMLIGEIAPKVEKTDSSAAPAGHEHSEGMEM